MNGRTVKSRLIAALVLATAVGTVGAQGASATTYCVTPATSCDLSHTKPSIASALTAADGDSGGPDVIELGATSYNETGLLYTGTVALTLQGAGPGHTMIAPTSTATSTLFTNNVAAQVTVQGIGLSIPGGSSNDIALFGHNGPLIVDDVSVGSPGSPTTPNGVILDVGGSVAHSSISLPVTSSVGINVFGSGSPILSDDTVTAYTGVEVQQASVSAHRLHLVGTGSLGGSPAVGFLAVSPATATIDDSLITIAGASASGVFSTGASGNTSTITARHVTVVGDGLASSESAFTAYESAATGASTINAYDSIARNTFYSVYLNSSGAAPATFNGGNDDFPGATGAPVSGNNPGHPISSNGASSAFNPGTGNLDVDPLFEGASDFHLMPASPALNTVPGPLAAGESTTDLDALPRTLTNGTSDMGAYQHQPPVASASASPPSAPVGTQFTFTGSGTDTDPGDTLSYHWAFDDGASASTATAMHAFSTAGSHTGTLTVTDATGLTSTATATVTATTVVVTPPSPPPVPDLENLTLTNRTFALAVPATPLNGTLAAAVRRGTTFSFQINTTAHVTLTFQVALPGRRAGHSCLPPRRLRRGHHDTPCTRYIGMGHINRWAPAAGSYSIPFSGRVRGSAALAVGRYRAILTAKNDSGVAVPRYASFTIVSAASKHAKKKRH